MKYTAFGEVRSGNGVSPTDYTYTGQRYEVEFGLSYYVARWYDSSLNQFIQPDTIIPQPGNALDWDRYAYVLWNPMRYTDPSGHIFENPNDPIPLIDGDEELQRKILRYGSRPKMTINPLPWDMDLPSMDVLPVEYNQCFFYGFGYNDAYLKSSESIPLNGGHSGIDISANGGSNVIWPFQESGTFYGHYYGSNRNFVSAFTVGEVIIIFNHIIPSAEIKTIGTQVQFEDVIGTVRSDDLQLYNYCDNSHLHFEVRFIDKNRTNQYINPLNVFGTESFNEWSSKFIEDYENSDEALRGSYP